MNLHQIQETEKYVPNKRTGQKRTKKELNEMEFKTLVMRVLKALRKRTDELIENLDKEKYKNLSELKTN